MLRISAWSSSTQGRLPASAKMSCNVCEAKAISGCFTTSSTTSGGRKRSVLELSSYGTNVGCLSNSSIQWPCSRNRKTWRYLAFVSSLSLGLCLREYPHKMARHMVQYLHFRILEFPLIRWETKDFLEISLVVVEYLPL